MSKGNSERINGFRREDLSLLKRGPQAHPYNAKFKLRARNRWIDGAQSLSLVSGFVAWDVSFQPDPRVHSDHRYPSRSSRQDGGPDPMEEGLVALAASLTTTLAYHAAFADLPIQEIECEVEGNFNIRPVIGSPEGRRAGFHAIRVTG